ncbi:SDR family oxidoreductase [Paralimibaculum aggregatum]|uniref:SDR family oxidoreductase n=1 Tax=Paralimibaculum aggregatum TaxID=3036245 RepID=A0ABQ6LJV9_9RHOB|nr:SDR family NAD(P)-dependent oxidoreductase [Limibaculum sp. NKW23]GMG81068.1 SDR family oxidoreductase [Limibaculum sp. NKW23]
MKIGAETPAVVTGGASGLGEACARLLAGRGAPVTLLDRDAARGQAVAAEIGARFAETDVTRDDSVAAALEAASAAHGPARIAINCAGIAPAAKVAGSKGAHPMDLFEAVVAVNLFGTMRVMAMAAQAMRGLEPLGADGERGVIVNTASVAAYEGQIGQAAYAASKGGVAALTLPAARDLTRDGIRVCAIAPGTFATPMLKALPEEVQASLAQQVPYPSRLGDPAEFARLAGFIVETAYMNGEVIRIDGAIRMGMR